MKIGFCYNINKKDANSGRYKFLIRLGREIKKRGIEIGGKDSDIYLYIPGEKSSPNAKLNVLRLDGLILNTKWDYKKKNKVLKREINKSDALIYQGVFCHKSYENFLKISKSPFAIIPNGASPDEFLPRNPKNYFLANCKWRPHKRLKDTVKSYLRALKLGLDSDLLITGEPDYKYKHPRIKYLKWQSRKQIKKLLSGAIASFHLTWLDWCPNSMVESIVAECPIIYTKSGGQVDLGKNSGIGIKDTQWNFKVLDLYDPPKIDRNEIAQAMIDMKESRGKLYPTRNDLSIKNVCDKYINFFEKIL